ncbi:hypothetical protein JCM10908_000822 [Rhodotorula pacifica]|uniref:uncharacterized protein n=1 Tax=Rhodotorula pacifica TaxID=1495444 RepID=UPI003171EEA1
MTHSDIHSASLLGLPIELQQHILSYTLPAPLPPLCAISTLSSSSSWSRFRTRSDRLRCYSLVTKQWLAWAQGELYKHVVIESDAQLRQFLNRPRRESTPLRIETLRFGGVRRGRQLDGTALSELFRMVEQGRSDGGGASGIREVWLVQVENLDLRDLRHLDDLRALICVSVSLAVHRIAANDDDDADDPSLPPRPVPPFPPRFPHLHTLVLQQVHISPFMRTILYESHAFEQLRVLAFEGAEVLEQVFDGNPEGLPKLVAMRPAHDLQVEYYTALDRQNSPSATAADGSSSRDHNHHHHHDGATAASKTARPGLLYLNASADFLSCIEHYAPWLPDSISRFSLDLDSGGAGSNTEEAAAAFAHLVQVTKSSATQEEAEELGRPTSAWKAQDPPGEVALLLGNLEELILPPSISLDARAPAPLSADADSDPSRPLLHLDAAAQTFLAHLKDKNGVKVLEPPEECATEVLEGLEAEQDRLIPWRFLVEADQTVRSLEAGSRL